MGEIKLPEPAGYLHAGGYKSDFGYVYREFEERHRFGEGKYPLYSEDQMRAAMREKDADIHHIGLLCDDALTRAERAEAQRDALLVKAREVVAWIRSGNSIPTTTADLLGAKAQKFLGDMADLDAAIHQIEQEKGE